MQSDSPNAEHFVSFPEACLNDEFFLITMVFRRKTPCWYSYKKADRTTEKRALFVSPSFTSGIGSKLAVCFYFFNRDITLGDIVTVGECRPLSTTVRFNVLKVSSGSKSKKQFTKFWAPPASCEQEKKLTWAILNFNKEIVSNQTPSFVSSSTFLDLDLRWRATTAQSLLSSPFSAHSFSSASWTDSDRRSTTSCVGSLIWQLIKKRQSGRMDGRTDLAKRRKRLQTATFCLAGPEPLSETFVRSYALYDAKPNAKSLLAKYV